MPALANSIYNNFVLLFLLICDFKFFFFYPKKFSIEFCFCATLRVIGSATSHKGAHTCINRPNLFYFSIFFATVFVTHEAILLFFASFFFPLVRLKTAAASSFSSFYFRHSFTSSFRISFFFSVSFLYRVSCFGCCRGDKLAVCPNQANAWTNERMNERMDERMDERSVGLRPTVVCGGLISLSGHSGLSGLMLGLQLDNQSK